MRICEHCCKEKSSFRTKKLCHACYQGISKEGKDYKPKLFKKDFIGTPCKTCGKVRQKKSDIEKELCRFCYQKKRIEKNPDILERHRKLTRDYHRKKRGVDTELPLQNAPAGTGYIGPNGYKKICKLELRGHPNADKKGRMFEHTYVMSKHIGRSLFKGETVHHKNGIRNDNRIENLELWSTAHGGGQRLEDKIKWCKQFLNQYGYTVIENPDSV